MYTVYYFILILYFIKIYSRVVRFTRYTKVHTTIYDHNF
jgi:hypothetical protein